MLLPIKAPATPPIAAPPERPPWWAARFEPSTAPAMPPMMAPAGLLLRAA